MSQEFLDKVKYLCRAIPKDEWSGPLFYTVEGSIQKPKDMKIILQDILPLDKGTAAYTSYELDNRFIDYMCADTDRMDWSVGHIHSHNTMRVFFSGTDMAELNDNAPLHNIYVSLIVNNFMDFEAKVAFVGDLEVKNPKYYANDEQGKRYAVPMKQLNVKSTKLFTYDCEVISPKEEIAVGEEFSGNVAEILKEKPVKTAASTAPAIPINGKAPGTPVYANNGTKPASVIHTRKVMGYKEFMSEMAKSVDPNDVENSLIDSAVMDFVIDLFRPDENSKIDDLEDCLIALDEFELEDYEIASSVVEKYAPLYEKHFSKATDKDFIADGYEVLDILFEYEKLYSFMPVVNSVLSALITKFERSKERC